MNQPLQPPTQPLEPSPAEVPSAPGNHPSAAERELAAAFQKLDRSVAQERKLTESILSRIDQEVSFGSYWFHAVGDLLLHIVFLVLVLGLWCGAGAGICHLLDRPDFLKPVILLSPANPVLPAEGETNDRGIGKRLESLALDPDFDLLSGTWPFIALNGLVIMELLFRGAFVVGVFLLLLWMVFRVAGLHIPVACRG